MQGAIELGPRPPWRGVDLSRALTRAVDGRLALRAPGLDLSFGAPVLHACTPEALCIAWGTPRMPDDTDPAAVAPDASMDDLLGRLRAADPDAALRMLRGGYALLHLDAQAGRVLLAVDRFSVQTVCYAFDGARLAFAERANAVPLAQRTLALQSLYDYLHFHCLPAPGTMFAEVKRLVGGSHIVAEHGQLRHGSHWTPRFHDHADASLAALGATFRALIEDAVRREAQRGAAPGCFLSGGTDSSTIAGMLARSVSRARTYSIGFDAAGYDEMSYARIAAQHFGTDHHEYYVTAADVTAAIPGLAAFCDQPFGNSSLVPAYYCAKMARADGVTHMLAGDGGDELFGGNSRYSLQLFLALYDRLPERLRHHVLEPAAAHPALPRIPGLRQLAGYVRHSRVPMPDRMETFNLLDRVGADNVLHADVLASIDESAPLAMRRRVYGEATAAHVLDRILYYDWKFTLADSDLPKVRMATLAAGTSVGYPFLADEMADFSLRIPARWKVRHYRLRWFFKHALRDFLPRAILRKKKHGFGLPFGPWVLAHAPLRALASDSLASLEQRGILRPRFRDELMGVLLPSHPRYYGELVWILTMLEQWLHAHQPGERVTMTHAGSVA